MDLLPPPGARSPLLEALALIIERSGFETFVGAPLLLPESKYFPEQWEPSERGVRLLSLRLLAYAGLEDLGASVALYTNTPKSSDLPLGHHRYEGAAAWFAGIDEGVCRFGADTRQLADSDAIVGVMCHEIAHAYREHHELASTTRAIDEQHTDITTVYLGFGVLTLNSTFRFRTTGSFSAGQVTTGWSLARTGYLTTEAMAYLLAAQVLVREIEPALRKRLVQAMGANQRACFEAACDELGGDVASLRARLGVPPREVWPAETPFVLPPIDEDAGAEAEDEAEAPEPNARVNEGAPVFRARTSRAPRFALWGVVIGMVVFAIVGSRLEWPELGGVLVGATIGLVVGILVALRRDHFACAHPECEAPQPNGHETACLRCGGIFRLTVHSTKDRLEAEDALETGRDLEDLARDLAAREANSNRRALLGVALLVALLGWATFRIFLPPRTTIAELRADKDPTGDRVRLTAEIVDGFGTDGIENPRTREEFFSFLVRDGSGSIRIWCDPKQPRATIAKGTQVRVVGRQEKISFNGSEHRLFFAEKVE